MKKILKIDRALYQIDDTTKTYRYHGRNSDWQNLSEKENKKNKRHINGYVRIFSDGRKKIFKYEEF